MAHPDLENLRRAARGHGYRSSPSVTTPHRSQASSNDSGLWVALVIGAFILFAIFLGQGSNRAGSNSPSTSLSGTWSGTFGIRPATLVVNNQRDSTFDGILIFRGKKGEYRIAVEGSTVTGTQEVRFNETQVLSQPWRGDWDLGTNAGTLSANGQHLSGRQTDSGGRIYPWSFVKR